MTYPAGSQRQERRTGKSVAIGTARPAVVTVIPAGSTSGWDIHQPMNVVQLYLPRATLERISGEADKVAPGDLLERTAHPDFTTSRLLMSAADFLDGREHLDALFRQQLTDLVATRLWLHMQVRQPRFNRPRVGRRPRRYGAPSNACARIMMQTSPWLSQFRGLGL